MPAKISLHSSIMTTRRRLIGLAFTAVTALAMLPGCNGEEGGNADGSGGDDGGEKTRLAFITNNSSDFWTIARAGVEKAEAELGDVEVDFILPPEGTAATQQRLVDDLLARGVDGVAISPVNAANQTAMLNSIAEQALLVTHDSDAPESDRTFYVGTDNVAAGREVGELLKKALPEGGTVMLFVGMADASNARERERGIREAIEGTNITIIDTRTDDTDRGRARSNAADTLVNYPDIGALVGLWSYNTPAILSAVRDGGKAGQVKIIGFDEEAGTLEGVRSGDIMATVVQQPYEFGYQAIKRMKAYIDGDKSGIPEDGLMYVPTRVIDKSNVDEFEKNLNATLGK